MLLKDLIDISDWISENYKEAEKIVEIGVGRTDQVIKKLKKDLPDCKLIATDIRSVSVPEGVEFRKDNVTEPKLEIYQNSDLIFSIRAPPELYTPLLKLTKEVKSDLLIKPVSSEESPHWGELINYSGIYFYLLKSDQIAS